jgi:DNA-binding response OmpR family regulator
MAPRIILVDDDPGMLQLTELMLKRTGYVVHQAESAYQALNLVNSVIPDLFILDVNMPEMNGIELCAAIRQHHAVKNVPVLMLSAQADASLIKQSMQAGANRYLNKPVSRQKLIENIQAMLPDALRSA